MVPDKTLPWALLPLLRLPDLSVLRCVRHEFLFSVTLQLVLLRAGNQTFLLLLLLIAFINQSVTDCRELFLYKLSACFCGERSSESLGSVLG